MTLGEIFAAGPKQVGLVNKQWRKCLGYQTSYPPQYLDSSKNLFWKLIQKWTTDLWAYKRNGSMIVKDYNPLDPKLLQLLLDKVVLLNPSFDMQIYMYPILNQFSLGNLQTLTCRITQLDQFRVISRFHTLSSLVLRFTDYLGSTSGILRYFDCLNSLRNLKSLGLSMDAISPMIHCCPNILDSITELTINPDGSTTPFLPSTSLKCSNVVTLRINCEESNDQPLSTKFNLVGFPKLERLLILHPRDSFTVRHPVATWEIVNSILKTTPQLAYLELTTIQLNGLFVEESLEEILSSSSSSSFTLAIGGRQCNGRTIQEFLDTLNEIITLREHLIFDIEMNVLIRYISMMDLVTEIKFTRTKRFHDHNQSSKANWRSIKTLLCSTVKETLKYRKIDKHNKITEIFSLPSGLLTVKIVGWEVPAKFLREFIVIE
jgi:hypothetical protein